MLKLLDQDAAIVGTEVRLSAFDTHGEALAALNEARRFEADARRLAEEVATLNPGAGELGEGKARNLLALAARVLG